MLGYHIVNCLQNVYTGITILANARQKINI